MTVLEKAKKLIEDGIYYLEDGEIYNKKGKKLSHIYLSPKQNRKMANLRYEGAKIKVEVPRLVAYMSGHPEVDDRKVVVSCMDPTLEDTRIENLIIRTVKGAPLEKAREFDLAVVDEVYRLRYKDHYTMEAICYLTDLSLKKVNYLLSTTGRKRYGFEKPNITKEEWDKGKEKSEKLLGH